MSHFVDTMISRRSIRKFRTERIPDDKVNIILKAAMFAPSARNTQAWQFIVINKREILDKLAEIHPYGKMLKESTLAVVVAGDKDLESNEGYLAINCSAATQNLLLAVHAEGLGAVWLGLYPREERIRSISDLFRLPPSILPVNLIAIGYPDELKPKPERFFQEKIHYNKW
jgi:nitroreductase